MVAFLADLPESAALGFRHLRPGQVVDNEDIDAAEPGQQITHAAVGAGQSAGQPALAHTRGADQGNVLMTRHPTGVVGKERIRVRSRPREAR
jgi:hypothetical protein